ncbi:hypothetical protein [Brunnivagina elsteri]|nr:hypothetical protein [Calothrix elsteri]
MYACIIIAHITLLLEYLALNEFGHECEVSRSHKPSIIKKYRIAIAA